MFASSTEPKELPLIEEVKRTPEVIAFEKELRNARSRLPAEMKKRFTANLKKLREPTVVADYIHAAFDARGKPDRSDAGLRP